MEDLYWTVGSAYHIASMQSREAQIVNVLENRSHQIHTNQCSKVALVGLRFTQPIEESATVGVFCGEVKGRILGGKPYQLLACATMEAGEYVVAMPSSPQYVALNCSTINSVSLSVVCILRIVA